MLIPGKEGGWGAEEGGWKVFRLNLICRIFRLVMLLKRAAASSGCKLLNCCNNSVGNCMRHPSPLMAHPLGYNVAKLSSCLCGSCSCVKRARRLRCERNSAKGLPTHFGPRTHIFQCQMRGGEGREGEGGEERVGSKRKSEQRVSPSTQTAEVCARCGKFVD